MLRKALRGTMLVLASVVIVMLWLLLNQFRVRSRAESFLRDLKSLSIGKSSFVEVKKLQAAYGGTQLTQGIYPSDCSPRDCYIDFLFTNGWLARLHLAPPTGFGATLRIHNGVLSSRSLGYQAEAGSHSFVLSVQESSNPIHMQDFCLTFRSDPMGRPWRMAISMRPTATQVERQLAYSFDLSCLARLGTCGEPSGVLPSLSPENAVICTDSPAETTRGSDGS
jgi:hypothetical protein